ncbi:hypothetical protein GO730_17385 [Spirosoma sp. HMF3257]|uniref:TonB C-terminal domain-containing protein n=1 Tax=Spirosoma telluris TaxID=2183553 RepID=A0A327NNV8_9BACT|nr:hypothetical protein [Spirosoma telluris]RAI75484.1 hypothetical protein HMF3257_17310 [Spirosoma telluris]
MKKNLALLMLVGFLATQAYAAPITTHKPKASKATLEQQLAKYISYPDALKPIQQAGIVVVQFRINSANKLCQVEVFSQNEQLNNDLIRQLTGLKLKGYTEDVSEFAQQVHTVRLRFKP